MKTAARKWFGTTTTLVLLYSLVAISPVLNAQSERERTEALTKLRDKLPDSTRIDELIKAGSYYYRSEWNYQNKKKVDSALPFLNEAWRLSESGKYESRRRRLLEEFARYHFRCDNVAEGSAYFKRLIERIDPGKDALSLAQVYYAYGTLIPLIPMYHDSILLQMNHGLHYALKTNDHDLVRTFTIYIADMYCAKGRFDLAEKEYLQVINTERRRHTHDGYVAESSLARLQVRLGNFNKALEYAIAAMNDCRQTPRTPNLHIYLSGVADIYRLLEQYDKSVEYYIAALTYLKLDVDNGVWKSNMGYEVFDKIISVKMFLGEPGRLLPEIEHFQRKYPPLSDYARMILNSAYGSVYAAMGDHTPAEKYLRQAAKLAAYTDQLVAAGEQYYLLAKLNVSNRHYREAVTLLDSVAKYSAGSITALRSAEIHYLQFKIDSAAGNYASAIKEFQQYITINDSIFSEKKNRQIEELNLQYQTAKNKHEIDSLIAAATVRENTVKREVLSRKLTLVGTSLLAVILLLALRAYHVKKVANRELKKKRELINQSNIALQRIIEEKEWLIKEMHHRVKNNLHTINSLLGSQTVYLNNTAERNVIRDSQHRIQAMSLLHQKLYLTKEMNAVDMEYYIKELVSYLKESFQTEERIQFELEIDPIEMDISTAVTLALILNEAITNSLKYAFPSNQSGILSISLRKKRPGYLVLNIADNGIGLPPGFDAAAQTTLGLTLLQGFSTDIDGHFSITSVEGTQICIEFPDRYKKPISFHLTETEAKQ